MSPERDLCFFKVLTTLPPFFLKRSLAVVFVHTRVEVDAEGFGVPEKGAACVLEGGVVRGEARSGEGEPVLVGEEVADRDSARRR